MQHWEYLWVNFEISVAGYFRLQLPDERTLTGQKVLDFLNSLGQQGWELVVVVDFHVVTPTGSQYTAWFKRPVE
jgi:hypothetical protein